MTLPLSSREVCDGRAGCNRTFEDGKSPTLRRVGVCPRGANHRQIHSRAVRQMCRKKRLGDRRVDVAPRRVSPHAVECAEANVAKRCDRIGRAALRGKGACRKAALKSDRSLHMIFKNCQLAAMAVVVAGSGVA
jgi:hypothetical protein